MTCYDTRFQLLGIYTRTMSVASTKKISTGLLLVNIFARVKSKYMSA